MYKKKVRVRSSRKLLLLLFLFFFVICVILFFNSSLSRISLIEVTGLEFLSEAEILQAAQVNVDDPFFSVRSKVIEERIHSLEIVESVKVTKRFPGKIYVQVEEFPTVAYQISQQGELAAILANGSSVQLQGQGWVIDRPILTGWTAHDKDIQMKLGQALAEIPPSLLADISEIKPMPSPAYPDKIKLYTRSHFEVITTVSYLVEKLSYLSDIIEELNRNDIFDGELTLLEADTHRPFPSHPSDEEDETLDENME